MGCESLVADFDVGGLAVSVAAKSFFEILANRDLQTGHVLVTSLHCLMQVKLRRWCLSERRQQVRLAAAIAPSFSTALGQKLTKMRVSNHL